MSNRKCAPLDQIPIALEKTGFLLEHAVAEEFRIAGWSVIGNRYYADDIDGTARELDLIAYRATKSEELDVFTGVLISCKKDAEHTWAFMSKEKQAHDPNVEWDPVHFWTDCEPLASFLSDLEWKREYINTDSSIYESIFRIERNIFAFQLISPDGHSPKNQKPIFDSIASLLKALDHEICALPSRAKNKKRIYIFTLLTVVDAPLVDVQYNGNTGTAIEIERITHLARYMVRKRDLSAQIHFIRSDQLSGFVKSLSELHAHNFLHMKSLIANSYEAIKTSKKVREYLEKKIESKLRWRLYLILINHKADAEISSFHIEYKNGELVISVDVDESAIDILNSNREISAATKAALKEVAKYEGPFRFELDIPF